MRTFLYCVILLVPCAVAFGFPDLDPLAMQRTLNALQRNLLIPENIKKLDAINPSVRKLLQGEINNIAKGPLAEANGILLAVTSAAKNSSDIHVLIEAARAKQAFYKQEYITLESSIKSQSDLTRSLTVAAMKMNHYAPAEIDFKIDVLERISAGASLDDLMKERVITLEKAQERISGIEYNIGVKLGILPALPKPVNPIDQLRKKVNLSPRFDSADNVLYATPEPVPKAVPVEPASTASLSLQMRRNIEARKKQEAAVAVNKNENLLSRSEKNAFKPETNRGFLQENNFPPEESTLNRISQKSKPSATRLEITSFDPKTLDPNKIIVVKPHSGSSPQARIQTVTQVRVPRQGFGGKIGGFGPIIADKLLTWATVPTEYELDKGIHYYNDLISWYGAKTLMGDKHALTPEEEKELSKSQKELRRLTLRKIQLYDPPTKDTYFDALKAYYWDK